MSPTALIRCAPSGGLTIASGTVSSRPTSGKLQCVFLPASAAVTSVLPHIPSPVVYSTRPESNGSIKMSLIHPWPPVVGLCQYVHGISGAAYTDSGSMSFHVFPPSVVRKILSPGHHRSEEHTSELQ